MQFFCKIYNFNDFGSLFFVPRISFSFFFTIYLLHFAYDFIPKFFFILSKKIFFVRDFFFYFSFLSEFFMKQFFKENLNYSLKNFYNIEKFFFDFLNDYGTQYYLMRMDHLFLAPILDGHNFFDKRLNLNITARESNFLSKWKFLNFFKLNFFFQSKNLSKQEFKISLIYDQLFSFKKVSNFSWQSNKLFNKILSIQHNLWLKNSLLDVNFKNFILNNVNCIVKNPFFPNFITFVFGDKSLKAQNIFDPAFFTFANKFQICEVFLSVFVDRFVNSFLLQNSKNLNNSYFLNYSLSYKAMEFFFFFVDNLSANLFFSKVSPLFKKILVKNFFGVSSFIDSPFGFELDNFFDLLEMSPNIALSKIFDEDFFSFLKQKRLGNKFFDLLFFYQKDP